MKALTEKVKAYVAHAKASGWKAKVEHGDDGLITCVAKRDNETITVSWMGNRFVDDARYQAGAYSISLRNIAAAQRKMTETPDDAAKSRTRSVVRRKRVGKLEAANAAEELPVHKRLPFDPETSPDEEVFEALYGRRIVWRNSVTGNFDRATIQADRKQKHLKISMPHGTYRVLEFCAQEGMFRAVQLDRILQVI